ncbi:MAG TPA: DinB family protein [Gemmatimonadales bacterium]
MTATAIVTTAGASETTNGAHLARLRELTGAIDARTRALMGDLQPDELLWRPAPDRWGIADCFEHLVATGLAYYPRVGDAMSAARPVSAADRQAWADEPYRATWFGRWFVRSAGPGGRPIRTRGPFVPPPATPDAPERFLAQQCTLRGLIARAAEGHDLRAIRIHSPLGRLLTLRLGECLEMLVAHELRHLEQAERVMTGVGGRR